MSQDTALPITSYALLGLLSLRSEASGYELKQLADRTLRFFWISPAMSQVYSECNRLTDRGLAAAREVPGPGRRSTRVFRLTPAGRAELERWLDEEEPDFPILKHPAALRLFLGHVAGPARIRAVLDGYVEQLSGRIEELARIRAGIGDDPHLMYPGLVAEWGQRYYRGEIDAVRAIAQRLREPKSSGGGS